MEEVNERLQRLLSCKQDTVDEDGNLLSAGPKFQVNLFKQPSVMGAINIFENKQQEFTNGIMTPEMVLTKKLPAPEKLRQDLIKQIKKHITKSKN